MKLRVPAALAQPRPLQVLLSACTSVHACLGGGTEIPNADAPHLQSSDVFDAKKHACHAEAVTPAWPNRNPADVNSSNSPASPITAPEWEPANLAVRLYRAVPPGLVPRT